MYYANPMKTITVRLPESLVADIEAESRSRRVSKSDVVRERLERARVDHGGTAEGLESIADLIGAVDGLAPDLSSRKKAYLRATRYGQKRAR